MTPWKPLPMLSRQVGGGRKKGRKEGEEEEVKKEKASARSNNYSFGVKV